MNSLISPTTSLFYPGSKLNHCCDALIKCLNGNHTSEKELLLCEQTLWNEVKSIQSTNDKTTSLFLIGYYNGLLYRIEPAKLRNNLNYHQFHYNIIMRLGDLNAFMDQNDVAEYYFYNAKKLFPNCSPKIRKQTRNIALESILSIKNNL